MHGSGDKAKSGEGSAMKYEPAINRHMNVPTLLDTGLLPVSALPRWEQAINWEAKCVTVPKPDDQHTVWRIVGDGDQRLIVKVSH